MKKILLIVLPLVVVVLLVGILVILKVSWRKEGGEEKSQVTPPSAYQIKNVPYYGEKNFCYGASTMMILRYFGLTDEDVQKFKQTVKTKGKGGPPDAFMGLKALNLENKVHLGYSQNYNRQFDKFYRRFLKNPQTQIINFTNQDEAFVYLKKLVSSDIPTIALIGKGNHYVVVTGYDQNYIYINDPDPDFKQRKMAVNDFLAEWSNYKQDIGDNIGFPGEYGMIWLKK